MVFVSSTTLEINFSEIDFGIYILDAAEHFWPWNSKPPLIIAVAVDSIFAEGWQKMKSFPPVSPTILG